MREDYADKQHKGMVDLIDYLFSDNRCAICKYCEKYSKMCPGFLHWDPEGPLNYPCEGMKITRFLNWLNMQRVLMHYSRNEINETYDPWFDLTPEQWDILMEERRRIIQNYPSLKK